jgi:anti-anti-sigma factor
MTLLTDAPVTVTSAVPVQPSTETPVLVVRGALDLSTLARVRVQLAEALAGRPDHLVVDLTDCTFVDASALAMLLDAHRRLHRTGGVLTLRGACPRVLRLLHLTGLGGVFDLA